jgi:hypothetical protein
MLRHGQDALRTAVGTALLRDERQHKAGFEPQQIAIGPYNYGAID